MLFKINSIIPFLLTTIVNNLFTQVCYWWKHAVSIDVKQSSANFSWFIALIKYDFSSFSVDKNGSAVVIEIVTKF